MNLYQINNQITELVESANPETGEIDVLGFEKLQMEKQEKQANVAKYILHLGNDNAVLDAEIERLKKLKTLNDNRQEWLKQYLKSSMEIDGVNDLDFTTVKVKVKKNPPKLVIDDEGQIPSKFVVTKIVETKSVDKTMIKAQLMAEDKLSIAGCHLEQETRLEIK